MVYLVQEELDIMDQMFLDEQQSFLTSVLSYAVSISLMSYSVLQLKPYCDGLVDASISFLPPV